MIKNILLSAYACDPDKGSEYGTGWNWAIHLAKLGVNVSVLTTTFGQENIERRVNELDAHGTITFEFLEVSKLIKFLYQWQFGVYIHYLSWQIKAAKRAKTIHIENPFDLVHHITYGTYKFGSKMWKLKIPFVIGPLGGGQHAPNKFKKYFFEGWKNEKFRFYIDKLIVKSLSNKNSWLVKADLILVTNEETKRVVEKIGNNKVKYFLDTGLPKDFFPESFPKRKVHKTLRLLWVGRIYALKGLPLVLETLSTVDSSYRIKLTIVGDGPFGKHVPQWIETYNLKERVNWIGKIPWDQVRKAYLENDVFIFTSLRDSFGAQLLEAMSFGLPIITLNINGAKIFVPENAAIKAMVTTPKETVLALAEAIKFFYDEKHQREIYGKNGYEFARSHEWHNKIKQVFELYKETIPIK